jgi:hypothetical protein
MKSRASVNCRRVRERLQKAVSRQCDVCDRAACWFSDTEVYFTVNEMATAEIERWEIIKLNNSPSINPFVKEMK